MPDEVKDQIVDLTACEREDIIEASARTGMGLKRSSSGSYGAYHLLKEILRHRCRH